MFRRTLGVLARGLLLSTALTQSAWPITPDQRAVVIGKVKPVWQWNPLATNALPADGSVTDTSPSLGGLVLDATGQLTYAPNNTLVYSSGTTLATQTTASALSAGGNYLLCIYGTGSVTLSGAYSGSLSGTGASAQASKKFVATSAAALTATVSGSVTSASLSAVTYETSCRPQDQVYQTTAYYGPKFDYGQGLRSWEQRQNVIRNNTMQGAVVSVARTTGSISSISRSGSTTVVVAATGHNVAVNDVITVSGATPSAYNGTYAVSAVNAGVSYSYVVASSATDTAGGATVVVVSPGTWPTNWVSIGASNGVNVIIVNSGVDGGLPYIDVRFVGKSTADQTPNLNYFDASFIPAVAGQMWTLSVYTKLIAGSMSGLTPWLAYTIYDSMNGNLSTLFGPPLNIVAGSLISQRFSNTLTIINVGGTTASIRSKLLVNLTNGASVDFTIRTAAPQSEFANYASPPILTYGSAVTASADALIANAPLSTALAAGPWAYSWTNGQTGVKSCVTGAAGAFAWPQNGTLRSLAAYRANQKARCIN